MSSVRGFSLISLQMYLNILYSIFILLLYCCTRWYSKKILYTYLLTYLLTYSMVQSASGEANWFAVSQDIPCILWNRKVHYRIHKRLPPVSILGQPHPVHIPTSHLLEIHPNINHPSTPKSPRWSLIPPVSPSRLYTPPLSSPIRAT